MGWTRRLFLETFVKANYVENETLRPDFPRKERKNAGLVIHNTGFRLIHHKMERKHFSSALLSSLFPSAQGLPLEYILII